MIMRSTIVKNIESDSPLILSQSNSSANLINVTFENCNYHKVNLYVNGGILFS